jgi:hypothetical protein
MHVREKKTTLMKDTQPSLRGIVNSDEPKKKQSSQREDHTNTSSNAHLLSLPSPHERRFGALVVYIRPQILEPRLRGRFGLFHSLINFLLRFLVKGLAVVKSLLFPHKKKKG